MRINFLLNTVSRYGITGAAATPAFKMRVGDAFVRRAVPCHSMQCHGASLSMLSLNHTSILSKNLGFGGHDDS